MLIPGIVSATFRERKPEDIIRLCVLNHLKGIEWSENAHIQPNDEKGAKILKQKTIEAGLEVAGYGSYYRLGSGTDPEKDFLPSLISAQALGAQYIRVWAGTLPSCDATEEQCLSIAQESAVIAEMAAKHQIKIAFEWHKNTLTDTNESAMKLLKQANHANLYCLWQPTVALNEEQRNDGLKLLSDRLLNLHVYYWLEGKRRPLSEGMQYWKRYFGQFEKKVRRYALLEFVMDNTEEQFARDAASLNQMIAECEGE
jgi:3-dehydroshikimate dehydratase